MGIKVKFNPNLALRYIDEYKSDNLLINERIPENLEIGRVWGNKITINLFYINFLHWFKII